MNQASRQTHPIDLESVFEALRPPIVLLEDEKARQTVEACIAAARVHQEKAIIDVLSEITAAINAEATETAVHLEYESKQLVLAIDHNSSGEADELARMDGEPEKVTIRLPAQLKQSVDMAADVRGVSVNTWCVWTLARAISKQMRRQLKAQAESSSEHRHGRHGRRRGEVRLDDPSFGAPSSD